MSYDLKNASLDINSSNGGAIQITGNVGGTGNYGSSIPCRGMLAIAPSGVTDVCINIGSDATSASMPVLATQYLPLPFCDVNLIYVYSSGTSKVNILYRN